MNFELQTIAQSSHQDFIDDYNQTAPKFLTVAGAIGIICYNLFIIFDYFSYPKTFVHHSFIRLGVVTPVVLALLFAVRRPRFQKYARQLVLLGAITFSLPVVYFEWNNRPSMVGGSMWGIILVAMFSLTALRMLQREAIIYVGVLLTSICGYLAYSDADASAWFSRLFPVSVVCFFGVLATHFMEHGWQKIFQQKKIIERQEQQAAGLLEIVFPTQVAHRLKKERGSIAEYAGNVSVLFADIEGFTAVSQRLSPGELVANLDAIFSRLDRLCSQYGCEKIKTVGDAYMAVCGVPTPEEQHAKKIVQLAMAMHDEASSLVLGGQPVKFRIGVHSGSVVAGVIGQSRFSYDLWGDTVNTASRMESTAPAGGIQITEETAKMIADEFVLEPRGEIQIKGKGLLNTWLVVASKETTSLDTLKVKSQSA